MAIYTWTGAVNNNWCLNGNWNVGGYPETGDEAVITAPFKTVNVNCEITVDKVTLNGLNDDLNQQADMHIGSGGIILAGGGGGFGDWRMLGFDLDCVGDIVFQNGALLVTGGGTITIEGDWNNVAGNFTHGNGKIIFEGAGASNVRSNNQVFYDFECVIPGKALTFNNIDLLHIDHIFKIQGSFANPITLYSDASPNTWSIQNDGNLEDVDFARIKDSDPVTGNDITANDSWDDGNNDIAVSPKWIIVPVPPVVAASADGIELSDEALITAIRPSISPDEIKLSDEAIVTSFTLTAQAGLQLRLYSPTNELVAVLSDSDESGSILDVIVKVVKIGGVDSFNFKLSKYKDVPITRNTQCYFYINSDLWFIGYVKEKPLEDQTIPVLTIEGEGFYKRLEKKVINNNYGPSTVDTIIKAVANTYLGAEVDVTYNVAKIDTPVVVDITIQFKDKNLLEVFTTLLEICNYDYNNAKYRFYVDNDKQLVFELISEDLQKHFFEGYQYQAPETSIDTSKITNKILAYRTKVGDPDVVEYVSSYDDIDSRGKYGLLETKITFPDYIDTATIAKICGAILLQRAEPQEKAEISDHEFSTLAPLVFGKYGVSNKRDLYWKIIADCDTLNGWNVAGLINTTLTMNATHVLTGRQSLKFVTAAGSDGESCFFTLDQPIPLSQKIRVFIYFEAVPSPLQITFYDDSGNELDIDFAASYSDQWLKLTEDSIQLTQVKDLEVNPVEPPSIINEDFEAPGYEEAWIETLDPSSSLNPESEHPGTPFPYSGNYCLEARIADVDTNAYVIIMKSNNDENYFGFDFYLDVERLVNGETTFLSLVLDNASDAVCGIVLEQEAGVPKLWYYYYTNGGFSATAKVEIIPQTWYRIDFLYDITNVTWAWRIDQVVQHTGALAAAMRTPKYMGVGVMLHAAGNGITTIYFDHIFWDDFAYYRTELLFVDRLADPDIQLQVRDEVEPGLVLIAGVRITLLTDDAATFYIDRLDTYADIYNYHELLMEEIEYHLSSIGLFANVNFGDKRDSIIDEIKGQVKEGNIALGIFSKQ